MTTTNEQVQVLLDLAGITPYPDELEQLTAGYPDMRAQVERLWDVEMGDTPPALVFRAGEPTGPEEI